MELNAEAIGGCGCSGQNGGATKRKLSAYNIFMKKEMKAMKAANPGKSAAECMKMAARKWRAAHPKKANATASSKPKKSKSKPKSKPKSKSNSKSRK